MKPLPLYGLRLLLLGTFLGTWGLLARNAELAFFIGHPWQVLERLWNWLATGSGVLEVQWQGQNLVVMHFPGTLYPHLLVTLAETLIALLIGVVTGLLAGFCLGLMPAVAHLLSPFIKAANAIPRVVLAPLFLMWFGLGMPSKIALAVSLVFFAVFFNVYQGVREVSPALLANVRLLGASRWQLVRLVYLPSAAGWVFSSLNMVTGLALAGVVVGEYLGASRGIGYLILQAEATFDVNAVMAGIVVLTFCALCLDAVFARIERRLQAWRNLDP
ncbi:ABC transporter permease [Pseudomonas sp. PSKL.D1]|uniref:ABC transporter permease n=1 Tax=Pseudomonas sp. PSKL.D1 TaxID=3029060 RepID=UPI0023810AB9|nr:ABC transporter permease [Pseudomonas sp. PSKL.D1]WDY55674.1 ABC transporter permease [Pseudomonas sp. PSKL.D1]